MMGTIADAYIAERLADEQLQLTERTLADWRASLDLTRRLRAADQNSGIEVAQAEGLLRQAEADLERRRRELRQATNALVLAVLIGTRDCRRIDIDIRPVGQPRFAVRGPVCCMSRITLSC